MSVIRSYAYRVELPREPGIVETDLPDLITASPSADALHIAPPAKFRTKPAKPVPGTIVTGTLPPDNRARFVLRIPKEWNGGLVVAAASGVTDETTYDLWFSDFALSKGFAFAATDKGVRRAVLDGDTMIMPMTPESSVRRWASRLEALISLAKTRLPRPPERTYAVGLSNGGFVARRAAELGMVDGALEVSGVMWRSASGNLLRELPALLRASGKTPWDEKAIVAAGFPAVEPKWKPLIDMYKLIYWEASLGLFVSDLDPAYEGALAGYDLDKRPGALAAIREFENTGDLKCPLISIAGRRDWLIPCAPHAEAYRDLVKSRGKGDLHRLEIVEDAAHVDAHAEMFSFVEPLMPRAHAAFEELTKTPAGR
jgi:pimeloyl-ACP methyl ester carboxylesterase